MIQKLVPLDTELYDKIFQGELEGIPQDLRSHLKYDRLSPGLKELLASEAVRVFKNEYKSHKNLSKALKSAVNVIIDLWSHLIKKAEPLVNKYKPLYIPPKMLVGIGPKAKFVDKPLYAEEVGCWIEELKPYTFITYWFKFPYDIWPGDGAEYEPWSIVIEGEDIIEYQARTHWRIVHIDPRLVLHADSRPLMAFADHAHTPVPILDIDSLSKILGASYDELLVKPEEYIGRVVDFLDKGKPISVEKLSEKSPNLYSELEDLVSMKKYVKCLCEGFIKFYKLNHIVIESNYKVLIHVGPSRRYPPPHNPLKERWVNKPIFVSCSI